MMNDIVKVDVRPDIQNGQKPCGRLLDAIDQLAPGQKLLLLAPFEPKPLFAVMAQRGYTHHAKPVGAGDWEVLFEPASAGSPPPALDEQACASHDCLTSQEIHLDTRGLQPPQPMERVLASLPRLAQGGRLRVHTDWLPANLEVHLHPHGFQGTSYEQDDGSFITLIGHRPKSNGP